jgi:nucleoside-diphosphate-sugar epimerase
MTRIAVVGASGLVGATLVERLLGQNDGEVVPLIHSSGNAWRLARHGIALAVCNLADAAGVDRVLAGCTHVVNCSRGDDEVMIQGLRNLLAAARRAGVQRFVHLSSVAVYGDPPPPESVSEDAAARPKKGTYGAVKLAQDEMVRKAAAGGLPAVTLCPPNISGCHSYFLLAMLDSIRRGSFVLAGDGQTPCNLVDVDNLVCAIELALCADVADGRRLFVTDDEPVSWKDVAEALMPLAGPRASIRSVPAEAIAQRWQATSQRPRRSLGRSLAHLVSGEVRQALRRDPVWAEVDTFARDLVRRLGSAVEDRMRLAIAGPIPVEKVSGELPVNMQLSAMQLRGVRHSCERAKVELGYRPLYTFRESMGVFARWHRSVQGMDGEFADLLAHLA